MKLRFIGVNGSMDLKHGEVYRVIIQSNGDYITVFVDNRDVISVPFPTYIPYSSPQSFAKNWEAV